MATTTGDQARTAVPVEKIVLDGLNTMRNEKLLCDVKLQVNGTTYDAHRNVLAAVSPYFRAMFCGDFKESQNDAAKKKESNDCTVLHDIDEKGFQLILNYIYTSELTLTKDNVCHVLSVSHFFQLLYVVDLCESFMKTNLSPSTYFEYLLLAEKYQLDDIENCLHANFMALRETEDFQHLPKETLCRLLSSDLLQINSQEVEVFRAALRWLEFSSDRNKYINEVMSFVRFTLIPAETLTREVLQCKYVREQTSGMELLRMILDAHAQPFSHPLSERNTVRGGTDMIMVLSPGKTTQGRFVCTSQSKLYSMRNDDICNGRDVNTGSEDPPQTCLAFNSIAICTVGNYLFVFGTDSENFSLVAERFDGNTRGWMTCNNLKEAGTVGHTAAHLGEIIILVGGMSLTKDLKFGLHDSLVTDKTIGCCISKNEWIELPSIPSTRAFTASCTNNNLLYVTGGYTSRNVGQVSYKLFVFDPKDNLWLEKAPMNQSRMSCMLNAIENKLYAIGGHTMSINKPVPGIEVYDTMTDQWSIVQVFLSNHTLEHHLSMVTRYIYWD